MSTAVKNGFLSRRVASILRNFEKEGHDVVLLLDRAIQHMQTENLINCLTDNEQNNGPRMRVLESIKEAYLQHGLLNKEGADC